MLTLIFTTDAARCAEFLQNFVLLPQVATQEAYSLTPRLGSARVTQLLTSFTALVPTWTKELNSRGELRVTTLDIKAAFDRTWHPGALAKLESMGIRANSLLVGSFLADRKMIVVVG
eukprot:g38521.t1